MPLPWPPHYFPDDVAKHATQNGVVAVHIDDLKRWQTKMQDAFDLGFKAAGGTIISARNMVEMNMVELSIDRQTLDLLAGMADQVVPKSPGLRAFLENISIYRSRK